MSVNDHVPQIVTGTGVIAGVAEYKNWLLLIGEYADGIGALTTLVGVTGGLYLQYRMLKVKERNTRKNKGDED